MSEKVILSKDRLGYEFFDESLRESEGLCGPFRSLTMEEVSTLEANGCKADNWDNITVKDGFIASNIVRVNFYGKNRIGKMSLAPLRFHDFVKMCGITDSTIISCDIGDFCAVHNVSFMSHYIVRDYVILANICELQTTDHSKFGNGIVKNGEESQVRIDLSVMNENLGRKIAPFEDLICADAFLWADNPADKDLDKALWKLTDSSYSTKRCYYGIIGENTVIKNCQIIKDVKVGPACYIKGCDKLKNLTIKSSFENPTQLGESCELVNGILGYGCRVFYGCKAIRFVMGENCTLKYGARLINSVLGDNSTVSCCEVLSSLMFPFHEQHHNNSFLISSLVMGQSNMAAGANIGSNHNSRAADGELRAGRGFWPALSSTIKFDSRFASFVLIAKGNYRYELNIKTPFTLLSDNESENRREIMPAYWWLYNMYALERNDIKFIKRDKRKFAVQNIESDYLAPDTVWEIMDGMRLLCKWSASSLGFDASECNLVEEGKRILTQSPGDLSGHEVVSFRQEHSNTPVKVLKVVEGYNAYKDMLIYYGMREALKYCTANNVAFSALDQCADCGTLDWVNLGGQLVPASKLEELKSRIKSGAFTNWKDVHSVYDAWFEDYPYEKALNAVLVLHKVLGVSFIDNVMFADLVEQFKRIRNYIDTQVVLTREKDYKNAFRMITYKNTQERDAVLGRLSENDAIIAVHEQTAKFYELLSVLRY